VIRMKTMEKNTEGEGEEEECGELTTCYPGSHATLPCYTE
jgi:hypothetical protein